MQNAERVKRRWMRWVLEEAEQADIVMPWTRGRRSGAWKRRLGQGSRLRLRAG